MILNDNSTQQINTLVIQLQNRITNLNNEFNKKVSKINDEISDLDTLKKEIADLVKDQINVDSSMNKQITENKNNIAANSSSISELNTQIQTNRDNIATNTSDIATLKTSVAGKADKSHTHSKSEITDFPTSLKNPNALTVNGKTYDGSTAVDAGVQTVANGGTGVTTQADINKAFIGNLDTGEYDVTDGTEFVSSWASDNGFAETAEAVNKPYKRKFIKVWNYIKDKIGSVLGLTASNYGGTSATILDYVKGTPIKVRWGGPGIDSAEWYPAFSADGSAIEPINRTNIHAGKADFATALEDAGTAAKYISTETGQEKKLVKIGSFPDGAEVSFLLTIKRTDGKGFTGFLTINSHSIYGTYGFNGIKSDYSMYEIVNGELVFLYRNSDRSTDVYMNVPSYASMFMLIFMPKRYSDIKLEQVSGFSGTLLDKF